MVLVPIPFRVVGSDQMVCDDYVASGGGLCPVQLPSPSTFPEKKAPLHVFTLSKPPTRNRLPHNHPHIPREMKMHLPCKRARFALVVRAILGATRMFPAHCPFPFTILPLSILPPPRPSFTFSYLRMRFASALAAAFLVASAQARVFVFRADQCNTVRPRLVFLPFRFLFFFPFFARTL